MKINHKLLLREPTEEHQSIGHMVSLTSFVMLTASGRANIHSTDLTYSLVLNRNYTY